MIPGNHCCLAVSWPAHSLDWLGDWRRSAVAVEKRKQRIILGKFTFW